MLVSLWVALVLLFEEECAEQLELEPASQEDIEADLGVPSERASAVLEVTRRLILQVKRHSSAPWSVSELEQVLKGQDSSGGDRKSALQRLMDEPGHRYILITDAQLPRTLQGFRIESLMAEAPDPLLSKKVRLPDGVDRAAISRRIGVLDLQHPERVSARIHALLSQRLFVPLTRVEACTKRLLEQARARLLNRAPRQWTRGEILRAAESFGGNPAVSDEFRAFVPPVNYSNLQHRLEIGHAIILQGPPGAGKTQVLEKLKHEYRTKKEPFEVPAAPPQTPSELREVLQRPGRIFIAIENPWGKFQRESGADRWVSELSSLLKLAGPDKKIVVTTREAILHEMDKNATETFRRFAVSLTYEHYDYEARRRILENKLVGALPWQIELVIGFEQHILDTLLAPLSIDRFVDKVKGLKRDDEFDLERMLKACFVEHLASRFIKELRKLDWNEEPVPAAISLWGLLSLSQGSTFSAEESNEWRRLLKGCTRSPIPWDKLIKWMVAGRWLIHELGQYHAHSTTVEGLERLLTDKQGHAEEVLEGLLSSLVDAKRMDEAHSLLSRVPKSIIRAPTVIHMSLRYHFRSQLVAVERERFQNLFYIASNLCHGDDHPVSLLMDGIVGSMRRRTKRMFRVGSFIPPAWTLEQKIWVHTSKKAREVAARYIEWLLPFSPHDYEGALASWLWSLGWDLTEDFQRAVRTGLEALGGADGLAEVIHGVLMSKEPAHEELLETLLRTWDVVDQADEDASASIRRGALQKMLSESDTDVWMDASAEIYVMSHALSAAVMERRHQQGYQWLLNHPRRKNLLGYWRSALTKQLPPVTDSELDDEEREQVKRARVQPVTVEELRAFYHCCMPDNAWALWNLVKHFQVSELIPELLETLVVGPPRYMDKCLEALCSQATENDFREQLDAALERASSTRRDAILFLDYMHDWASVAHSESAWIVNQALEEALSSPVMPALLACRQVEETGEPPAETLAKLGSEDRRVLRKWSCETDFRLGRAALVVLAALGEDVTTEAQVALQSSDTQLRRAALKALGWSREPRARASLLRALEDEHYECRLLAIQGLTSEANEAERQLVIALARDGTEVLTELLKDLARSPGERPASMRFAGQAPGENPNVLELRSLAMRGLVEHLAYQTTARQTVDLEPLLSMSSHPRERLAIPAWSGLAFIGERAWNDCFELLTTGEAHTDEKAALLVFISTRLGYPVRQGPIARLIPEDSPVWTVAEWIVLQESTLPPEWNTRWAQAPAVLAWIKALHEGDTWQKYVRSWLERQFGAPFIESLSSPS
ncbi:HEAT repeat domain-containing protein [Cystobacter fuscus]|uniref:HEAT repeat domain-containing protein n=1 Tax=Cystobacter fuscus TaxID=43 RepID=UPI0037BEE4CC